MALRFSLGAAGRMNMETEFVVHYLVDFGKRNFGDHVSSTESPRMFWAINGFDQLLHHLTYIALAMLIVHNL